jgi:signal peptidase II
VTVLLTVLLDQLSKAWALSALEPGGAPKPLLGSLLELALVLNPGGALSIGNSTTWVFTIVATVVVVVVVRLARRLRSRTWAAALGLLLGGAVGNLADRLFRAPGFPSGHVVDFIDYHVFVGNVADIAIVLAAVMIVLLTFFGVRLDGTRQVASSGVEVTEAAEVEAAEEEDAEGAPSDSSTPDSSTPDSTTPDSSTPDSTTAQDDGRTDLTTSA